MYQNFNAFIAFYVAFGFGKSYIRRVFDSPLQAIFDCMILAIPDISDAYDNLVQLDYSVVARVNILKFRIKISFESTKIFIINVSRFYFSHI